jgi:ABC-type uncharacterized transport system permease subunit
VTSRFDPWRVLPQIAAPVAALLLAIGVSSIALVISNINPTFAYVEMFKYGVDPDSIVNILNAATIYYIGAIAVAIGFRMALFNIGVDGQLRLAGIVAAAAGGWKLLEPLPGPIHTLLIVIVAMSVGAMWAGIAGLLKVTRGVSEVIATIMLNAIASGLVAFMLRESVFGHRPKGSNSISTRFVPEDARVPGIQLVPGSDDEVYGFIVIAIIVGVGYMVLLNRSRFGFDLRATGMNPTAAVASGVDVKRMVVASMLISGAVAGLTGLPLLLGGEYTFSQAQAGTEVGFTAIAIALLGRNHPVGIGLGAVLWAFLDRSRQILAINEISTEIVVIMQGITVLSVVVAYELANRIARRAQQQRVGAALARRARGAPPGTPTAPAPAAAGTSDSKGGDR